MPQDWFDQNQPTEKDWFDTNAPKIEEKKEEPSLFSKGLDLAQEGIRKGEEFVGEHPVLRRFFYGPSEEDLGGVKLNAPTTTPGNIPGLETGFDKLKNIMINSGSYPLGFTGGLLKEWMPGIINNAFDPGNAGIKNVPKIPVPQPQKLLPSGAYHVNPEGEAGIQIPIPRRSMRESLGGVLPDVKGKVIKSEIVPRTAQDYINARKTGKTNLSFEDFKNEIPQAARSEQGGIKIGADIKSLGKVLGSSLYKGDISKIATKELLQNAVDATRHLGENAHIKVEMGNKPSKYIQVSDNGKGMTREELETVFTDLGASGKRNNINAVGGFGLAKAAPLLGGERVEVQSIVNENGRLLKHTFSGTPDELLEGVNIQTVPAGKREITGTTVRTYVPENSYQYEASNFVRNLAKNSPELKGKIEFYHQGNSYPEKLESERIEIGKNINLSTPSADVNLIIPKNAKYGESVGVPIKILNNGMYQTSSRYGGWETIPSVPDNVLVDIKSKVPEGHPDYPFTANREELRGTVHEAIGKYIQENIVNPGIQARSNSIKKAYESIPIIGQNGEIPIYAYDVGQKFTPEEFAEITQHPFTQAIGNFITDNVKEILRAQNNPIWENKLEKIGLIFDDKVKGIHIPNPGEKKSAILINPFQVMEGRTPKEASAGIMHTMQHEVAHLEGGGHDENFTIRLSQIVENHGAADIGKRLQLEQLLTGNTGDYLPEIQDLLSKYIESRRRESTIDDPLYGTGIGSANKGKRTGKIPRYSGPPSDRVIGKLLDILAENKISRAKQDVINSIERGKRAAAFESVKEGGKLGFKKSMAQLGGEYQKVNAPELKLGARDVDSLFSEIKFNKKITTFEKARAGTALGKLLEGNIALQRNELILLDRVFGPGTAEQILELHGGLGGIPIKLAKTANTMKSMMATLDLSAPFRQGLGLVHRKEFWNSFIQQFKFASSHDAFMNLEKSIEDHPNYLLSRDAGLFIADHTLGNFEEQFMNSYLHDIREAGKFGKLITEPASASERAYVGFLNKLRFDTFNSLLEKAEKAGLQTYKLENGLKVPTDLTRQISNYVNVSTGRGSLGRFGKYADDLNNVLFSPRLISSRLTILNPKYYVDAPPFVRKEALKTLFAMAGFVGITGELGSIMGGESKLKPSLSNLTNPDYGKIKWGNVRLDPGGGLNQYITAASQFISGKSTSSTSGNTYDTGKYGQPGRFGKLLSVGNPRFNSFLENKMSPMASFIDTLLSGKIDPSTRKPYNIPTEIRKRFTPLMIQDLTDLYKEDPSLMGLGIPASFGMGLQVYGQPGPSMGLNPPSMNLNLRP